MKVPSSRYLCQPMDMLGIVYLWPKRLESDFTPLRFDRIHVSSSYYLESHSRSEEHDLVELT